MFIFSIPEDIPNNDTINTIAKARKCHGTLPNEPAICPKYTPESVAVNALPVIYPTKNRINHPTTIAYPIAIINVPTTGITPNTFPPFFSEEVKNSVRLFFHRSDTIQSVQKFLLG